MRRFVLIAALAVVPMFAQAQAPAADPSIHRHRDFFLRVDAGAGYMGSTYTATLFSEKPIEGFTAASVPFGIAFGGAVVENFILAFDFWGICAISPATKEGPFTAVTYQKAMLGGFGLNLTYYFMPINIYVSLTPSLTVLSTTFSDGRTYDTLVGFGGKAAVGKEWWVGDHTAIGLAAQFFYGANKQVYDRPDLDLKSPTYSTMGFALAVSATYN